MVVDALVASKVGVKNRTLRGIASAAAIAAASFAVASGTGVANAHDSTYCGHGIDGYWQQTAYRNYIGPGAGEAHQHVYDHFWRDPFFGSLHYDHSATRYCGGHGGCFDQCAEAEYILHNLPAGR